MIIAVDAMGGDLAPAEPVRGALLAHRTFGIDIALVGEPEAIRAELASHGPTPSGIEIVPASEVIAMDEVPVRAVRQKKQASINVAMGQLKQGAASAVVSAGNTGATMASALLNLGRVAGVERPAIGAMAPFTETGILILDVGANADCKPSYLEQFAYMGSVYMEMVFGINRPRVGLLNIGEEETKGNELTQDVYARLKQSRLNFVGNIEPDRVHHGPVDVLVSDGFTGNVAVKVTEGVAEFIFDELKTAIMSKLRYRLAALVLRPALMQLRSKMDYGEYGGAPLLGVNGVVIVAHGKADAQAMKNAVRLAQKAANSGMLDALRGALVPPQSEERKEAVAASPNSDETRA
ncbi:MAG: phosphate acyltransferase PlsX [Chloroflexi bacterium]|nr:phosphate acyltransferase PlsX [Chloroflexota bacterium]